MIDIHSHTTYSDDSFSVGKLLREVQKIGLSLLSITDHNTVQAYYELQNSDIRNEFDGKILPGIEITTTYKGETIEVLGYGFYKRTWRLFSKNMWREKTLYERW